MPYISREGGTDDICCIFSDVTLPVSKNWSHYTNNLDFNHTPPIIESAVHVI